MNDGDGGGRIIQFPSRVTPPNESDDLPAPVTPPPPNLPVPAPPTSPTSLYPEVFHPSNSTLDLTRYGHDHPLGPFLLRYHPEVLADDPGPTAEQRGWVITEEDHYRRIRHRSRRDLVTVEREAEVVRMWRRGVPTADIADKVGIAPSTVASTVRRAMKRTLKYAGADAERQKQLIETGAAIERVMEAILPDPTLDDDGREHFPTVDPKMVEALIKVQARRAALTGADQPAKIRVDGEIQHNIAVETVDRVTRYIDVIDQIQEMGYGSGQVPPEVKELAEKSMVEVVDIRPLDERVGDHVLPALPFRPVHQTPEEETDTGPDDVA